MIDVYKILKNTVVEGPGTRFCIWTQGCKKHCLGCWAQETWEFGVGTKYSVNNLFACIKKEKENIEGVTFLGGEPFEQAEDLARLSKLIKSEGLTVVCFTGYTIEELKAFKNENINRFLEHIDLLIDGGFEKENYDLSRPWVGSSNQRYIFLSEAYTLKDIESCRNKIEMRIFEDGRLEVNGMGNFDKIREKYCLQLGKNNVK